MLLLKLLTLHCACSSKVMEWSVMVSIDYSYYYVVNSEQLFHCIGTGRHDRGWCSMGYQGRPARHDENRDECSRRAAITNE